MNARTQKYIDAGAIKSAVPCAMPEKEARPGAQIS